MIGSYVPNHQFIIAAIGDVVLVRSGKQVVRHIGVDISVILTPLHVGGDTLDIAHELFVEGDCRVGIAFHTAFSTVPGPSSVPRSA